ncbi:hypothetical protein GRF29_154g319888 [Pseudopithomyces chartarum]|uniref:Uncharacterized protein n=1 Tax=Pseudopithomyces chartarum TaxID=1892770 RepID=A0AAN6RG17_9PLEO|nr:hypothetical protein GRF29_154g319888 [Pseudopithomyces chartarum]
MLRRPNNIPPHLRPINTLINLLIHPPTHRDRIPPHNVQPQRYLFGRDVVFRVVDSRPDDALDGGGKNEVHAAVAGLEGADHGAAVEGEDRDLL